MCICLHMCKFTYVYIYIIFADVCLVSCVVVGRRVEGPQDASGLDLRGEGADHDRCHVGHADDPGREVSSLSLSIYISIYQFLAAFIPFGVIASIWLH